MCSVINCKHRTRSSSLSFYSFPVDEIMCRIWVEFCGNNELLEKLEEEGTTLMKNKKICSGHFKQSDFRNPVNPAQGLKRGVVPSVVGVAKNVKMKYCSVHFCFQHNKAYPRREFYNFPTRNAELTMKWVDFCNDPELKTMCAEKGTSWLQGRKMVCSDHFAFSDFKSPLSKYEGLIEGACPVANPDQSFRQPEPEMRIEVTQNTYDPLTMEIKVESDEEIAEKEKSPEPMEVVQDDNNDCEVVGSQDQVKSLDTKASIEVKELKVPGYFPGLKKIDMSTVKRLKKIGIIPKTPFTSPTVVKNDMKQRETSVTAVEKAVKQLDQVPVINTTTKKNRESKEEEKGRLNSAMVEVELEKLKTLKNTLIEKNKKLEDLSLIFCKQKIVIKRLKQEVSALYLSNQKLESKLNKSRKDRVRYLKYQ